MSDLCDTGSSFAVTFGRFRLIPSRRLLLDGDTACTLGSRAFEILMLLVERAGQTVPKPELLSAVWPGIFVAECNLRVQIAALRKALGDGRGEARYIVNVAGNGYCFVAPVQRVDLAVAAPAATLRPDGRLHGLPAMPVHVVGRDEAIREVVDRLSAHRCVTIAGPGGIGKTTVAVAAAERLACSYEDGVWFVDLAAITDPALVATNVAAVLGLPVQCETSYDGLIGFLNSKRSLLILDNCEHLVGAVATLVDRLVGATPHLGILATSRDTLRVDCEWVHQLGPIAIPPDHFRLGADAALRFPAVQLLVACAAMHLEGYRLTDTDVPAVVEICRRLEGVPLAIELAAARVDLLGMHGLAKAFDDRCLLQSPHGRRCAAPRHQSLTHALDWSYRLLSPAEQTILGRLSVFKANFTLDAAAAVASGDAITVDQVYASLLALTSQSLVSTRSSETSPLHRYYLLYVTRVFAGCRLTESGDRNRVARRHAEFLLRCLAQPERECLAMERQSRHEYYAECIDDVRAALEWAFSPRGDLALGVELTAAAIPLGFDFSFVTELREWVERALAHVADLTPRPLLAEMRLNIAWAKLASGCSSVSGRAMARFERARELSRQLAPLGRQVEPLIARSGALTACGSYAEGASLAVQAIGVACIAGDLLAVTAANRVAAQARHFNGEHEAALQLAHRVLECPPRRNAFSYLFLVARRVSMRVIIARAAWITGFPEKAACLAGEALSAAQGESAVARCLALALGAIPIALWSGDDRAAEAMVASLSDQASRHSLSYWQDWAELFRALLRRRSGDADATVRIVGTLQCDTAPTLAAAVLSPLAIERAENGAAGWCAPELCRAHGELVLARDGMRRAEAAEALFEAARRLARQQGAVAWELRAATSLARLWLGTGRRAAARSMLSQIVDRFTEGHATADLREAAAALDETRGGGRVSALASLSPATHAFLGVSGTAA